MALFTFVDRPSRNGSIWDPFSAFHGSVLEPLDGFSSAFGQPFGRGGTTVDWIETPEAHVFKADLPGLTKEDIKVEVLDGRTLSISGKRNKETIQEKDNWRCVERSHGEFRRQFGLPENAKVEEVVAKTENGVLTITVPKMKLPATPQVRAISIT